MVDADDTLDRRDLCESCGRSLGVRRYLQDDAPALRSFCSEGCLRGALAAQRRRRWRARRRGMKVAVIGVAVAGACLAPHQGKHVQRPPPAVRAPAVAFRRGRRVHGAPARGMVRARVAADGYERAGGAGARRLGPSAGRADPAHAAHRFARVRRHAAGRSRDRMPERALRRRSGRRDLGRARARRARRRRRLRPARREPPARRLVRAHLPPRRHGDHDVLPPGGDPAADRARHVREERRRDRPASATRAWKSRRRTCTSRFRSARRRTGERYIDPEPLIALWPLRVPIDDSAAGLVTTLAKPGLPLGSAGLIPGRKRKLAAAAPGGGRGGRQDRGGAGVR